MVLDISTIWNLCHHLKIRNDETESEDEANTTEYVCHISISTTRNHWVFKCKVIKFFQNFFISNQWKYSSYKHCRITFYVFFSLQYLNYPTQVIFKSCKLIPVLIGGILIQRKQKGLLDFVAAIVMSFGLAIFLLADSQVSLKTISFWNNYGSIKKVLN